MSSKIVNNKGICQWFLFSEVVSDRIIPENYSLNSITLSLLQQPPAHLVDSIYEYESLVEISVFYGKFQIHNFLPSSLF